MSIYNNDKITFLIVLMHLCPFLNFMKYIFAVNYIYSTCFILPLILFNIDHFRWYKKEYISESIKVKKIFDCDTRNSWLFYLNGFFNIPTGNKNYYISSNEENYYKVNECVLEKVLR